MFKTLGKATEAVGTSLGLVEDGANYVKEKMTSTVEEERIIQAKERILLRFNAMKEIAAVTGLTINEAAELLDQELNK